MSLAEARRQLFAAEKKLNSFRTRWRGRMPAPLFRWIETHLEKGLASAVGLYQVAYHRNQKGVRIERRIIRGVVIYRPI
jgi:hypothetical protein